MPLLETRAGADGSELQYTLDFEQLETTLAEPDVKLLCLPQGLDGNGRRRNMYATAW